MHGSPYYPTNNALKAWSPIRYGTLDLTAYSGINVNEGEYVVLSVSDDGPGIYPTDLDRIFEPFYTKKIMGRSGTGLGLAVVWNVMQDHKG